ncbi:MAG TPA: gephyrin-like molybdotransferase Glp [Desulfomonilaceae bacterium]|nr:gephyrin-like molybdotransferase Glp [Desulfomonilaceae bacterium]
MQKPFLQVLSPDETRNLITEFPELPAETSSLEDSLFRVLAEPVTAREDSPRFDRSTMDGFAVRSVDTFGATESAPALFHIVGEIAMGEVHDTVLKKGQAVRIWTGGALPAAADSVVMVEHAEEVDRNTVEVLRAVAPFDNVVRRGEDFKEGETLLEAGHRLRPQDLGLLAAMGRRTVRVFKKPAVAIISSGDEIVPIDQEPPPGCVRDVNRYTLSAMVREAHAEPVWIGIATDDLKTLTSLIQKAMQAADMVIVSGGSSMGARDHVIEAIQSHTNAKILVHGVSVSPGKPLILAKIGSIPVLGLPGHPVSAMVCFEQFVTCLCRRLEGEEVAQPFLRPTVQSFLSRNVPSKEGRTDFVRVRLQSMDGKIAAIPVPGKSGVISAMVRAHGYIVIGADCEGAYKGDSVIVSLFADWMGGNLEKEYLSRYEAACRGTGHIFETPQQEKISGI